METVLLKLSGELLTGPRLRHGHDGQANSSPQRVDVAFVQTIAQHLKQLQKTHRIHIVVGGGNFFRGARDGVTAGLRQPVADTVGMLATVMNGLLLQDIFASAGVASTVMNAIPLPGIVTGCDQALIDQALKNNTIIIFTGGTGNPYVSTDTAAIIRALQIGAQTVWKASNIDGVYDADPAVNKNAQRIKNISYDETRQRGLRVMDMTAITLAQEHAIVLRVFSIFTPDALSLAAQDKNFGSTIQ
jgi:uridylate kinase